ncbi:MAG: restriction endonuclease [Chloroflexi bacterium]|nr:restriction endonuclease [Chloroflexota bacterium]
MAVPTFQSVLLPLLRLSADRQERTGADAIGALAEEFKLTQEERKQLLPSGRQRRFDNRVTWGVTYLAKAKLVARTGRGRFQITERGREVLQDDPSRIDIGYLMRFPEFAEFKGASAEGDTAQAEPTGQRAVAEEGTPEELLESSYQSLRTSLAKELLDRVKACSPDFFEELVVDLLVAMGYGGSRRDAGQAVGQSGDGGIDGIIKEDKLGLDIVYIQAKRWEAAVGRPTVQAFAGSLEGQRARKGVLITTSQFTADAKDYVNRIEKRIILIDGEQMAQLMIDYDVGVAGFATYRVKKVDLDYFGDGP